jgi:molybdate transport system ATP-binding protein
MLQLDLAYRRRRFALRAQVQIGAGVTGICGPSGSGKSTLLALIAGLLRPESGSIRLDRTVLVDTPTGTFMPPWQRRIGLVFQDALLFPHLSVRDNLLYGYRRLGAPERRFELGPVSELLEIAPLLERRTAQLSGGERSRVALGRALLMSPRLLLLDEPLAALDDRLKQQILPFLKRIGDQSGVPMLYVSHAMAEVDYLAARVLRIEDGHLTQERAVHAMRGAQSPIV